MEECGQKLFQLLNFNSVHLSVATLCFSFQQPLGPACFPWTRVDL